MQEDIKETITIESYTDWAMSVKNYGTGQPIIYPLIGISGESGEVSEKVKKVLRDKEGIFTSEDKKEILKELGDIVWYIAAMADDLGFTFKDVLISNQEKVESRRRRGVLHGSGDNR